MTLLSTPPGTIHGELLQQLISTCAEPKPNVCRFCQATEPDAGWRDDAGRTLCGEDKCVLARKLLVKAVLEELQGARCYCGRRKQIQRSFCGPCYFALPGQMRADLYKHMLSGYLDAYAAARKFFEDRRAAGCRRPA